MATGGFYFAAEEATDGESLRQLGAALGAHLRLPSALSFGSWREAFDALLGLGNEHPIPVVIDEFPYLARANSALPSILQNAIAPLRSEREASRSHLLLCGPAMTFMGTLLSGSAPLRGRAGLELVVPTLDYQLAAQFWNLTDPTLAIKVHAIVGGTPCLPARLWERSQSRFTSNVLDSHFEQLARHWTRYFAPQDIVGGFPARVEPWRGYCPPAMFQRCGLHLRASLRGRSHRRRAVADSG